MVGRRRCGRMRGGAFGATLKRLAGRAHDYLKSSKVISTKAMAHPHALVRAAGQAAEHFGYGRRRRRRRGGALKLAGMGRRMRMRALPMAY
jgi:hypothetical protein